MGIGGPGACCADDELGRWDGDGPDLAILIDDAVDDAADSPRRSDGTEAATSATHRLRDLDRRGRWCALALALASLLAPLLAFAEVAPHWAPSGDPAFMALRALDVGSSRTPLIGQPSSAAHYIDENPVHHLGPTHFYLLAPAVRIFGLAIGMLLVSVLITGSCVLIAAWAVFRQLGPRGGVLATVVLGAITFTTGASSLVNPVSSNISGYPLLCSMVLLWCLLCGDHRLLPLTVGIVSFAAQQHLSVVPGLAVATVATVATVAGVVLVRHRRRKRSTDGAADAVDADDVDADADAGAAPTGAELVRWSAWSAVVGLVLWSPVLVQQLFSAEPNLSTVGTFARHDERPTLGFGSAIHQVVHVLGLPPLLGRQEFDGWWLQTPPSAVTWVSAGSMLLLVAGLGVRWRRSRPRQAALVLMVGVLVIAGLINGSSVPAGVEQFRSTFYHWAFALTFFVTMSVGLALVDLAADRSPLGLRAWSGPLGGGAAVVAIAVPSLVNPSLDRSTNTLFAAYSPVERQVIDQIADGVMRHEDELGDATVLVGVGDDLFIGISQALSLALTDRGLPVLHPFTERGFVDHERLAKRGSVDGALVVVVESFDEPEHIMATLPLLEGKDPIAEFDPSAEIDQEAFEALVDQAQAVSEVHVGAGAEAAMARMTPLPAAAFAFTLPKLITDEATTLFRRRDVLELLRDHPLDQPRLDAGLIDRVLDTLPPSTRKYHVRVYELDRAETLQFVASGLG
jgi:hypothetical protein